ncbi:hypothetical protein QF036_000835 [Arthrobacter globiformis]|nr:hypothetical protein [Arthrobacter globiformis]
MSHANAALTPRQRLRVARLVVDHGWPVSRAAEQFNCSWPTAKRWAARYAAMGPAGMTDRSSSPHRVANRTPPHLVRKVVHLRWKQRLGPVAIGAKLAMPASTVHAVLVRCRLNRLHYVDKRTGEIIRRYEHDKPGAMIHVDVKKLGNIPDGGGWRYVGRQEGKRNRATTPAKPRSNHRNPLIGTAYVHTLGQQQDLPAAVAATADFQCVGGLDQRHPVRDREGDLSFGGERPHVRHPAFQLLDGGEPGRG